MSPRPRVHQFLPALFARDAVGNHTIATHRALRRLGLGGRIWAEVYEARYLLVARRYRRFRGERGRPTVLLYQVSTGSDGMGEFLLRRPEPLLAYYHNITPAEYLEPYDGVAASLSRQGRDELARLAPRFRIALAASEFSARELRELGVADVRLMVPYFTPVTATNPDRRHLAWLQATKRGLDLLFVGRLFPHKRQDDLIRVTAALGAGGVSVRLFLVGSPGPHTYVAGLRRLLERLNLRGSVFLVGAVSPAQLAAHYAAADVFLCMSEHEGFCIPLVDAMAAGLPIVACEGGAVQETLGGAGVLLTSRDALVVAEVVARIAVDRHLRQMLTERGRVRAETLLGAARDELLLQAVRLVVEG